MLSSLAALRTGAGYVTLASTKEVCRTALPNLTEAVMMPLRQNADGSISYDSIDTILQEAERSSAILLGNGLGTGSDACHIVYDLIQTVKCPLIIDADGINAVAKNIDIIRQAQAPVVFTPHLMELSRLTTLPPEQIRRDLLSIGKRFAEGYGVTVVLKDAYTNTIAADGQVYINTTGNAGLAKAGSGDVLAGMVLSLIGQGAAPFDAAVCAVWLHGRAGDLCAGELTEYAMIPPDLIERLPAVFKEL